MAEQEIGWKSPRNDAGEHVGFNDGGLEHFNDNPLAALANEVPQNSQDAKLEGLPVHLDIKAIKVPRHEFPDIGGLHRILSNCLPNAMREGEKANKFFENALQVVSADVIDVFALSDYNTRGAEGPCLHGQPFHTLLKSTGATIKATDGALGSFGIGKNAPYANSSLRTVFISTAYKDGSGEIKRLVQGKALLISHSDEEGNHEGRAYWGLKDGFQPIDPDSPEGNAIPAWLTDPHGDGRTGTTVFVAGFDVSGDWERKFTAHYLKTFFPALSDGLATAKIGGIDVNSETLPALFADQSIEASLADDAEAQAAFRDSRSYFKAISGESAEMVSGDFGRLGHARLEVLIGEGLPKKVAVVRNGMLITDQMAGLKRFAAMADFAAVLRFDSKEVNDLLRKLEPPRHDAFEIGRLKDDPKLQKHVEIGMREAANRVRAEIEERARGTVSERINLSELSDKLGLPEEGTRTSSAAEVNPLGRLHVKKAARLLSVKGRRKASTRQVAPGNDTEGHVNGKEGHGSGKQPNPAPTPRDGAEGTSKTHSGASLENEGNAAAIQGGEAEEIELTDFSLKSIRGVRDSSGRYRLSFVPPMDAVYGFKFEPVGYAKTDGSLAIASADGGQLDSKGFVRIPGIAGRKASMSVQFADSSFDGAVKVLSYAV